MAGARNAVVTVQSIRRMISGQTVRTYGVDSLETLAWDIARRLRTDTGKVVVVCERSVLPLPLVKQHWEKTASRIQTTPPRTFSLEASPEALEMLTADVVVFATVEQLLRWAPECRVMYVTCPIEREKLYMITAWMDKGGRVVVYNLKAT